MIAEEARRRGQGEIRLPRPHETRRAFLLIAALVALPAAAQVQTYSKPGVAAPNATAVQGIPGGIPVPVTATVNVAGASDTVGNSSVFNANSVCATVLLTGQPGAGFFLGAGTLAATLTPSISEDATPATPGCTGGNYTPSKFIIDVNGNTAPTLVLTNPNAFQHVGIATLSGTRCVKVCTTAWSAGTATGFLVATVAQSPPPAPSADVTDRPARQVGKVYGSDGFPLATANSGRPQVDIITGAGGTSDPAATAAASESATTRSSSTSALRVLDTAQVAGSQLVTVQGTAANGARVDVKASVLPTGAATEATLAGVKVGTDKIPASPSQEHATAASPEASRLSDGAAFYKATTPADTQPVSAAALPLPAGASTEATLSSANAKLADDSGVSTAASESFGGRLATTAGLRLLDTGAVAGSQLVAWKGDLTLGAWVNVKASVLPTGAATEATLATRAADATLTGGSAKAIMRGGAKGTTAAADVTSTPSGVNHQPADVILYDAAGSALDPRTRSWTLSSGTDSVNVGNFPATYDTSDRVGRLLGILSAGSNIIGKVGIDQTTPGTTNGVQVNAALPAGTNVIGHVIADSGSTTAVSSTVYPTALTFAATGQQAVTATAVALPANAAKVVCLKVLDGGTQNVKFGISGVTTGTGSELVPGEGACRPASNTNAIFVIAGAVGSTIAFEAWQ